MAHISYTFSSDCVGCVDIILLYIFDIWVVRRGLALWFIYMCCSYVYVLVRAYGSSHP